MTKAAWIGLGAMGFPMAGHLQKTDGLDVTVYNRTTSKADDWVQTHKGASAQTPAGAAEGTDYVFACVGNDDDLREVTIGPNGVFNTMKPGAIFIDHTTTSADVARELYEVAKSKSIGFLDAPVSGGQAGAENGQLTVMVGGDEDVYAKSAPVISAFAKAVKLMGPSGSGQLTKMVNQIAICGLIQSLSEAIHFAKKAELDIPSVIDTISKGAAQSWQMDNRWETMSKGEFDFGFAVDWIRKDLGICFDEAKTNGADLPITKIIDTFYAEVQEMGGNRWDTSSLIARLDKN